MRIAIIGSGIAGNVVAHHLHREHDITLFEAASHIGGHTHTHTLQSGGREFAVDTGFIVYNDWTYPNFIALLDELGVASRPSRMSFGVKCELSGLEYCGSSLDTLFAQRGNLLRPGFHRMLRDILRFNREAPALLAGGDATQTLGDYLAAGCYGDGFVNQYLVPMGAAIWSADPRQMLDFPALHFIRFFHNHGLLSVKNRPQWRVIEGGSREYVKKLTAPFSERIRLNTPVFNIKRCSSHVEIHALGHAPEKFDQVFMACHSDQALRLLEEPTPAETAVLGAIPYQRNEVILHTDTRILPRKRRAWAAWNYHRLDHGQRLAAVTYNMNILQGLDSEETFCVTLNNSDAIDPDKVIKRLQYDHPVFTRATVAAQQRQAEINGALRTWYCGAYWRNGFHEDGVVSALDALQQFKEQIDYAQQSLRRAG